MQEIWPSQGHPGLQHTKLASPWMDGWYCPGCCTCSKMSKYIVLVLTGLIIWGTSSISTSYIHHCCYPPHTPQDHRGAATQPSLLQSACLSRPPYWIIYLTVGWDQICDIHYLTPGTLHLVLRSEATGIGWSLIHPGLAPSDTSGTSSPWNSEVSEAICGLAHSFSEMG